MKKAGLLLLSGALVFAACQKDPVPSKDATLDGKTVDVSAISTSAHKLFVLNEGGMGANNATLDFLRFEDGKYITGSFKKMNPDIPSGLGDVGNDIAIHGDEAWIVVNNSGIVEVISAQDETEIAAIQVPTPRNVAFDGNYAYVTSWAGAYIDYKTYESSNPQGQVYRINLNTKKVEGTVEVGLQPEGIAVSGGKLYVANSGGISSQIAPDYAYDNTLSVIDTKTFTVEKTVEVQVNLKYVYAASDGSIYVTSLGNYGDIPSALYQVSGNTVKLVKEHVSVSSLCGDTVYCVGTETEFDFKVKTHEYSACSVKSGSKTELSWTFDVTAPYGLMVLDPNTYFISDAGNYFDPGTVSFYSKGSKIWSVTAGVCPGHFALY